MRDTIISKITNVSAKQFSKVLTEEDKIYLHSLGVVPEKTRVKTLGKQTACLLLNINDKKCIICNSSIPYVDFKEYLKRQYCSNSCKKQDIHNINVNANNALRNNNTAVKKREDTIKAKYGVVNIMHDNNIKDQRRKKCRAEYGVDHSSQRPDTVLKRQKTNLARYGVSNYLAKYIADSKKHPKLEINYNNLCSLKNIVPLFSFEDYEGIIKNGKPLEYKFKCNICSNTFVKNIGSWNDIEDCIVCNRSVNSFEKHIESLLVSHNIVFEKHNRSLLNGLEIDFYLPDLRIGIEIDGLYYHSNKFIKDKHYHINKTKMCEAQGVRLLHIFGDEFYNIKALNTRLKSILGLNKSKIGARKCEIRQIDSKHKSRFLSKYHLQGDLASNINYGLFYKNRLLSVMTFGNYRKSVGSNAVNNEYELYRYCTMSGVSVIGGAAKLFQAFIREFNPEKIISYADRRYTSAADSIYTKIGMTTLHTTIPNYWIVVGNKRLHRFGYRKSVLHNKLKIFNEELTEHENLRQNNINIIYDCGSIKYEYIHKK